MSCFLLRLGDALARALRPREKIAAAAPAGAPGPAHTEARTERPCGEHDGLAPAVDPPQRPEDAGEGGARQPSAGGAALRRSGPSVVSDPQAVRGQLTLLEAQATKLKATIRRRKKLQGGSGAILGHYERVLAGLEGEIALLGGTADPDRLAGDCSP